MRSLSLAALVAVLPSPACEQHDPPPFDGVADADVRETRETRDASVELPELGEGTVPCTELTGPVTLSTRADLAKLEYARIVRGDLVMTPVEGLWDSTVREITGGVRVVGAAGAPVGAHVALVALSTVGGDLELRHTTRGLVDLYRLVTLGGSIEASDGGWALWTPALTTISGGIDVRDATHLVLTLDNLTTFGGPLRIERAQGLGTISLGRITRLETAGEAVRLVDNPDIEALALGALTTLGGDVTITGNGKLARATIDQALQGIVVTGTTTICGNLDDEACP